MSQLICMNKDHVAVFTLQPKLWNDQFSMRWTPMNSYAPPFFNVSFDGRLHDPNNYPSFIDRPDQSGDITLAATYIDSTSGLIGVIKTISPPGPLIIGKRDKPPRPFKLPEHAYIMREDIINTNSLNTSWVVISSPEFYVSAVNIVDLIENKNIDEVIDIVHKITMADVDAVSSPQVNYIETDKLIESIELFNDVTKHSEISQLWKVKYPGKEIKYNDVDPGDLPVFNYMNAFIVER